MYMYEMKITGHVGMAQKFNFYLPHIGGVPGRCAESDYLTI